MDFAEYQEAATRTKRSYKNKNFGLAVYSMGLAGEAGETVDYLKKVVGHDHDIEMSVVEKELGDVLWYVAALCDELGLDMSNVAQRNVDKLKKRYPEGFSADASRNRAEA